MKTDGLTKLIEMLRDEEIPRILCLNLTKAIIQELRETAKLALKARSSNDIAFRNQAKGAYDLINELLEEPAVNRSTS